MSEHCFIGQDFVGQAFQTQPAATRLGFTQVVVAHVYGVPLDELLAPTRKDRRVAEARQVAMYLGHVVFRMSLAAIARVFGRDRSTASYACKRVEDLREDPEFDRLIAWLEVLLRNASGETVANIAGAAK